MLIYDFLYITMPLPLSNMIVHTGVISGRVFTGHAHDSAFFFVYWPFRCASLLVVLCANVISRRIRFFRPSKNTSNDFSS